MNPDILFWWTGGAVWLVLSVCISLGLGVGLLVGVCAGYRAARTWAGLRIIRKAITEDEMHIMQKRWPSLPAAIDHDVFMAWVREVRACEQNIARIEAEKAAAERAP